MKTGDKISTYCRRCEKHTLHTSLFSDAHSEEDQIDESHLIDYEITDSLLRCDECKIAQFLTQRLICQTDEWYEHFFPAHPVRHWPAWAAQLPPGIATLLREAHEAFAANQRWLVGMGCRTLIDMFAVERVGDVGTFGDKLKRLMAEGILSEKDVIVLQAAIDMGHDAAHSIKAPSADACMRALDIVENLIQRLCLPEHADRLRQAHPRRKWPRSS